MTMTVRDTVGVSARDSEVSLILPTLRDKLTLRANAQVFDGQVVSDQIGVRDAAHYDSFSVLRERVGVRGVAFVHAIIVRTVRDRLRVRGRMRGGEFSAWSVIDALGAQGRVAATTVIAKSKVALGVVSRALVASFNQVIVRDRAGGRARDRVFVPASIYEAIGVSGIGRALSRPEGLARARAGVTTNVYTYVGGIVTLREWVGVDSRTTSRMDILLRARERVGAQGRATVLRGRVAMTFAFP